jgi:uncharacterized OB-fold protein
MCGANVDSVATECPSCGEPFSSTNNGGPAVKPAASPSPEKNEVPDNWREEWIDKPFRDMSPEALMKQPPHVLKGVSEGDSRKMAAAFNIKTVEDFAKLDYAAWAQELVSLKETPSAYQKSDFEHKIDKEFEDMELDQLLQASTHALQGVSEDDAKKLVKAFNTKTVEQLGSLKYIAWARQISEMVEPTGLDGKGELTVEETEEIEEIPVTEEEEKKDDKISSVGCPVCGSKEFTVESGDMVSCAECGNVYIKKEFEGVPQQSWKWKFWVGFVFVVIGDIGVALGSYVHNIYRWSPLGDLYLGYGWIDQLVGILGIVIFILGLILFAWSFKRDREVQCPSCKVFIREAELTPFEEEKKDEETLPEDGIVSAVEEIEMTECPNCGAKVSIYEEKCPECDTEFEKEVPSEAAEEGEEAPLEEEPAAAPEKVKSASELDEEKMVLESLELLDEEITETPPKTEENGVNELKELEAEFELALLEEDTTKSTEINCPECGMIIEPSNGTCPICGSDVSKAIKKNGE